MIMFAIIVAALSFTACSDDDDDNAKKTLVIDGVPYYCGYDYSDVVQIRNSSMLLSVAAVENKENPLDGHLLKMEIPPSKVSELSVGQVFNSDEIRIYAYRVIMHVFDEVEPYNWNAINGNIVITEIKEKELTIQINNLTVKHKRTGVEHNIAGTATLYNSVYDSNGVMLPFSDSIIF